MPTNAAINPVQRSLSRPLTILERNGSSSFRHVPRSGHLQPARESRGRCSQSSCSYTYFGGRPVGTATDPQILRLLLHAAKMKRQYDPAN